MVRISRIFDIERGDLKVVFSYIINMMETAMKMTPSVNPTKPGPQRDLEIESYHDEVWAEIYACIDESLVIPFNSTRIDIS